MTWDGIRDPRILTESQLRIGRIMPGSTYEQALLNHIDALHNIMRYCHDRANAARSEQMKPGDPGWSTMASIEVLLEEHLPQEETTTEDIINDTTISGYYVHGPVIDPPDRWCPRCHEDEHACACNQPPHEAEYLAWWRDAVDDGELDGYSETDFVVGFERVVAS